jgi:ATP-dependent helicase/nuclease subunit A
MSERRKIPDDVREVQAKASDPTVSAWVAANAGSGKTHVLAQRVIRLLLRDFDPARILCITFTKAAAANMANRVFDVLRQWIALDDAALAQAMRDIGVNDTGAAQLDRARRLFALALETPGGLKVQTIHAFCTSLLHLFPFEANVAAHFEVLDEITENELLDEITLKVLLEAAANPDSPLGRALATVIAAVADITFREMIREAIRRRDDVTCWVEAAGSTDAAIAQLSQTLGIRVDEAAAETDAEMFDESLIAASEWETIAGVLAGGSKTDVEQGARFQSLAALNPAERLETYIDIFCTRKREKTKDSIATGKIKKTHPDLYHRLNDERDRVWKLVVRQRAIAARDRTSALVTIACAVIGGYRDEKDRRGLLDYDDLIDKTLELLREERAAWVHYKLDRGIDHVLIDEAQDTSPKQWAIIRALVAEFFAGLGAHTRKRTIFAVGDEKQSIFSFQGAAPRQFAEMRREFERLHNRAELTFVYTQFKRSFRSGPNVLGAVDTVFERAEAYAGLTADPVPPVHLSLPQAAPGLVELWDTERPAERPEIEAWDAPFDEVSETSPQVRLAQRIARHVRLWRQNGRRPKDVLILVRRRGAQFEAIIRALKNENIPVAGADRLILAEHIAVMDLMVLADAVLLPQDDLALATVLKSPLFGLDDDALFKLAWDREGSLHAALRAQQPELAAHFDLIRAKAREWSPFSFYAWLLGAKQGRRKFLARLGHEAADALDEFLNLALEYEHAETPSLQGFVDWLRAAQAEVKRDMEMDRNEVRVMTVHGAKGLEAPIVILADTTTPPQGWHPPRLLSLPDQRLVWAGPKANDIGPMAAARQAALDDARNEYRRLLYVAMTRAIDRLIVCGTDGKIKRPGGCWYDLVRTALEGICVKETADDGGGEIWRYRKTEDKSATREPATQESETPLPPPNWLFKPVEAERVRAEPIKPSGFADDPEVVDAVRSGKTRQRALARGNFVHRLLQSLPDIPPEHRAEAARNHVARQQIDFTDAERETIVASVLSLLDDSRFTKLFLPGSRAEVPIVGRIDGRTVNGVVDRLVVTPEELLIADYKTNRPAPRSLVEIQIRYQSYIKQLALYRAVLMRLYPGRLIRAVLVWTDVPETAEIPSEALDAALAILTAA